MLSCIFYVIIIEPFYDFHFKNYIQNFLELFLNRYLHDLLKVLLIVQHFVHKSLVSATDRNNSVKLHELYFSVH